LKEHNSDKDKITELILKYKVDLIVVGANKLESRLIKQTLTNIA
jgi:transcriptional accessory protein Tex/SPT6